MAAVVDAVEAVAFGANVERRQVRFWIRQRQGVHGCDLHRVAALGVKVTDRDLPKVDVVHPDSVAPWADEPAKADLDRIYSRPRRSVVLFYETAEKVR